MATNLKMVLADKSEISLLEFGIPMHAITECANEDEVLAIWKRLTSENLQKVDVVMNDEVILQYRYAGLETVQSVMNGSDSITMHIYMGGEKVPMNEQEMEYIKAAKILLGEES